MTPIRLLSFGLISLFCLRASAGELKVERVFGPEAPGPYKHPASITQLESGDFYLTYYGGEGEYATDTAVYGSRLKKSGLRLPGAGWSKPEVIADTPWCSEGNPVIWQAPDGLVWLFYVNRPGETWSTSIIKAKISSDGARSWSDSMIVADRPGMMVRNQPIVLNSGEYYLPVYHETGHDTEMVGPDSASVFLRFSHETHRWSESGKIVSKKGNIQPGVVQLTDDHLIAYCRRGGGYEPTEDGWMVRAESRDGGRTWSEGKDTEFKNPNSAIEFMKLASGNLLLIYNDNMNDRTPLTAAISTDGDKTWKTRNIMEGEGPFAYPYAVQAADGKIHLIFTSHERSVINRAVFDEAWVLEQ